jgi:hypothetical protein
VNPCSFHTRTNLFSQSVLSLLLLYLLFISSDNFRYENQEKQTACKECPGGSASGAGAVRCGTCFAGKVLAKTGNNSGAAECMDCPIGSYSLPEATNCLACEKGKSSDSGDPICTACKPGTYRGGVEESGAGDQGVPDGKGGAKYSAAKSGECIACTAGRYSVAQASVCAPCAAGQYLAFTNGSQCEVRVPPLKKLDGEHPTLYSLFMTVLT